MLANKTSPLGNHRGITAGAGRGGRACARPHPTRSVTCAPRRSTIASPPTIMSDSINVVFPRKLLKEFISLYQRLPCLWDKHCASYKMKHKRHEAITKLTQLVQMYDPSATRVHVLRKIESLRACVRREYKRVQNSKKTAENESEIYTPHLWYYDLFSFMFQTEDTSQEFEKTKESASSPQSTTVVRMYK
uniref:SFRICE_028420 n=1 Tax=Spodoptera frugiperda TaxID=7108 RepID=A0A2H1VAY0_SPOFR